MSESDSAKLAAVAWIREQMERYALTIDDLVAAGCFDTVSTAAAQPAQADVAPSARAEAAGAVAPNAAAGARPLYRNALGQSWDGQGEYPDWLQRAVNAGQSIEFFRVN
ncbi:H-NS family nucleoid-associated regulatory protein [Cupriavidus lacunae]|uniref:Histone-like nucleoid-structuring protein n=1 Tax=Cupriavidus lacunae TaxID=2666307 RepID=A0A370NXW0_9BURK|nr:H-NS family nucleoid-associated regulatory protein [Cupriavidus lacunae]RDK10422.1 histone-like nucleoid-structuring protein [Cupriavidus lacunae]